MSKRFQSILIGFTILDDVVEATRAPYATAKWFFGVGPVDGLPLTQEPS